MQRELVTGQCDRVAKALKDKSRVQNAFAEYYYSDIKASHKANGVNDIKHTYARMTDQFKRNMGIGLLNPTAIRLKAKLVEKMMK